MIRVAGVVLGIVLTVVGAAMIWQAAVVSLQPPGRHATWGEIYALWAGYDTAERLTDALQD